MVRSAGVALGVALMAMTLLSQCSGSAIPMWEFLSRGEKVGSAGGEWVVSEHLGWLEFQSLIRDSGKIGRRNSFWCSNCLSWVRGEPEAGAVLRNPHEE